MCDILDTISLTPPPMLDLNHQLFLQIWLDGSPNMIPQIHLIGDLFQSKSHPYDQSSKRPQIISRVFIKSNLNTIHLWMQLFILTTSQAVTSKTSKISGRTTLPELELEPWHKCCHALRLWWIYDQSGLHLVIKFSIPLLNEVHHYDHHPHQNLSSPLSESHSAFAAPATTLLRHKTSLHLQKRYF